MRVSHCSAIGGATLRRTLLYLRRKPKAFLLSQAMTYFIDMLPLTTKLLVIEQEIFLLQYFQVLQNQSDADTKHKQVCQR